MWLLNHPPRHWLSVCMVLVRGWTALSVCSTEGHPLQMGHIRSARHGAAHLEALAGGVVQGVLGGQHPRQPRLRLLGGPLRRLPPARLLLHL